MTNSLVLGAGNLLWDGVKPKTSAEIITLLKGRYENANQVLRRRMELISRRRKKTESVSDVYEDVKRLAAQAKAGGSIGYAKPITSLCGCIERSPDEV